MPFNSALGPPRGAGNCRQLAHLNSIECSADTIERCVYRMQAEKCGHMPKAATTKHESERRRQSAAFGRAIYELRIKASLSQEQLALESGVGRSYVSVLERGGKEPCLGVMFKLAKALKTDVQSIVGLTEQIFRAGYTPNIGSNARVR